MSQNNGDWGKHRSVFTHGSPQASAEDFKHHWDIVQEKNPGIRHIISPDYQYNYYDPPHDLNTAHFLHDLNSSFPLNRHNLLRKFLPQQLYQFKALLSRLPYSQLQQLREQLYIGRIGDLGTNAPCIFTRRHWIYRLTSGNHSINSQTLKELPLGELMRWYKVAITNIYTDCAEEEYLRYKFCLANRMPLVMKASIHNPTHYDPSDNVAPVSGAIPAPACEVLMGMVHDSHRYFTKVIDRDCQHHFHPFYQSLVNKRDLNESLINFEKLQRCAIGREIRARVQTDTPRFAGAWQIFGRSIPGRLLPAMLTNWIEIRSNPVVEFEETDSDILPIFDGVHVPLMKPLIDELRTELVLEGKLAPEPLRSYQTPYNFIDSAQTPASMQQALAMRNQPISFGAQDGYFHDQSRGAKALLSNSLPPSSSYVTLPPHMLDDED